ncbi:MAG: Fe-S cluster assembly protein SufD [Prevotellaceae bacterium]|nr:Fe-S cluster assembly protein SufD [Prevotellaceae bacterium]
MSGLQQYLRLFDEQRALIDGNSCAPLNAHRDDARRFLSGVDLPNRKTERYKYTNASAIFAGEYHSDFTHTLDGLRPGDDRGCAVPNLATVPVHVINDVVVPLADDVELPEGVHLLSLCRAAAEHPEWLERYYDRAAHHEPANQHKHADREERDVVTRLNTLFAQDGLLIHVAAGVQMERTVQIVFRSRAAVDLLSHRRLLIVAEAGASVNVLVCEHADGTHRYLTTQVTEIYAAEDAAVSVYTLEETREGNHRFSNVYVEQQARSRVSLNGFSFTTGVSRTMTNVRLLGTGADCQTAGVAITDGRQHVDNNLLVDHVAEACTSDMLFKYVLDGESRAAFGGKVMVRPGAQQTLSHQNSANLCISPTAHVHSLPMLEIYADDVRCNHGSTIGKLDESALLYLRQRGIPLAEARLLLQHAFVAEVLQRVPSEALRDRLSDLVERRFRGEQRHCADGCEECAVKF